MQKKFDEYKRKSEEIQQQQLKMQEELKILQTQVDENPKMVPTLLSGSIKSQKQLLSQVEQCTATPVATATSAINNLEYLGRETEGTYVNWHRGTNIVLELITMSELKKMSTKLGKLDVTVKPQKTEAMTLINQLRATTETITVTKNRRFPLIGDYCDVHVVNYLYTSLERIDDDCVNIDYNHSKSVIFTKYVQIGNDRGWRKAHSYGRRFYNNAVTPQLRLDKYLCLLCKLAHSEEEKSSWFRTQCTMLLVLRKCMG